MTLSHEYDGSTLVGRVDLAEGVEGWSSSGDYGQNGVGSATIDDPIGNLTVVGWRTFNVFESACSIPDVFRGLTFRRPVVRMDAGTGNARQWDTDLVDLNVLLTFRRIPRSDASAKRPAETDIARVSWLLSSGYMTNLHDDIAGIVATSITNLTDNPIAFGEADYRGRTPLEVLQDISGISGKRFGVRWDPAGAQATLFYDLAGSTISSSTLRISADEADESDPDTYAPQDQITFSRSPEDVYDKVLYDFKSSQIVRSRSATHTSFKIHRDGAYSTDRVGKLATAETQAAAWLENHSGEVDFLEVTILLPPDKVNLVREFDRIEVKIPWLPGYSSFQWLRVLHRVVGFEGAGSELYRVKLELDITKLANPGNGGGGGGFPQVSTCDIANVTLEQEVYAEPAESPPSTYTNTWDTTPTPGNLLVYKFISRGHPVPAAPPTAAGWDFQGHVAIVGLGAQAQYIATFTKTAEAAEPMDVVIVFTGSGSSGRPSRWGQLKEWAGVDTVDVVATAANEPLGTGSASVTITPTAGTLGVIDVGLAVNATGVHNLGLHGGTVIDDEQVFGGAEGRISAHQLIADASGSYTLGTTYTYGVSSAGMALMLSCSGATEPPLPGQQVPPQPPSGDVDGSNTDFVAPHPFSDGSLRVLDDGIDETTSIATYDGETGDFTLNYAPAAGSVIETYYQGR